MTLATSGCCLFASTKVKHVGNNWVRPPGPDWWQNRISIDIENFRGADDAFEENLHSCFYSEAVQEASHSTHVCRGQQRGGTMAMAVALCPSVLTLFRLQFESAPHRHAEPILMWPCFGTPHHLLLF